MVYVLGLVAEDKSSELNSVSGVSLVHHLCFPR